MKVSINMIVKNEEFFVEYALRSVLQIAHEYVIVDNGSTDKTKEIISRFFEKHNDKRLVFIEGGNDDFAETRNLCMKNSSGDWILIVDGDEVFYNEGIHDINNFFDVLDQNQNRQGFSDVSLIYLMFYHFYGSFKHTLAQQPSPVVRVLKNKDYVRWIYPDPTVKAHEIPTDLRLIDFPNLVSKFQSELRFCHFGYCKSNADIWLKGYNYQNRGHHNHLWEREVDKVLNGTEVVSFKEQYPSVMNGFPFYKYKSEIEERNGKFYIRQKNW